nr:uncharacterized mitochondrial protein AtMg00810-like [Tanacetum cinerariifolium]
MAFSSLSSSSDNEVPSCSKACSKAYAQLHSQYDKLTVEFCKSQIDVLSYQAGLESVEARLVVLQPSGGYNVVPPPIIGNFMPPKPELVFHNASIAVETDHSAFTVQLSTAKPTPDLSHTNRPSTPIIEEWVSDSEDESETTGPQIALSFVQSTEQVKPPRHSVQPVETSIPAATPKPTSPKYNRSGKRKNRKTCFVCKSVDHLIKDCDYHAKKKAQPTPRNYAHKGNHKQYASLTHKKLQNHMAPTAVLTQSKPVFNTAVRPVSAVVPKIMVTRPRLAHSPVTKSILPIRRHITCSPSPKTSNPPPKVIAVKAPVVSAAQGMKGKWIPHKLKMNQSILLVVLDLIQACTPIETHKPLVKDKEAADVDVHLYRSMIGSLMYLTASRPDIMFGVCTCSRFQVTPKLSHLHAVKWIFRYLKGQPKIGLWYPKYSPFDLEAYSNSDYAGANLDRKSTTGCCQFLSRRLFHGSARSRLLLLLLLLKQNSGLPYIEFYSSFSHCYTVRSKEDRMEHDIELANLIPQTPHDSTLSGGHTPGSDKGSMALKELMDLCTTLLQKVFDLENVKTAQAKEFVSLKKRVTKLEQR